MALKDAFGKFFKDASGDVFDEGVKAGSRQLASLVVRRLSPEAREFLKKNSGYIKMLKAARVLIPNTGPIRIANEGWSDFIENLEREVCKEEDAASAARKKEKPQSNPRAESAAERVAAEIRFQLALFQLSEEQRGLILEWIAENPDNPKKLQSFMANLTDRQLIEVLQLHPGELEAILETVKPPQPKLSYDELQQQLWDRPDLLDQVKQLEDKLGTKKTYRFRRAINGRFATVEDFAKILAYPTERIEALLHIADADPLHPPIPETLKEHRDKINARIEASGAGSFLERLAKKMEEKAGIDWEDKK